MISLGAPIISLEHFALMRPDIKGKLVATSTAGDPMHPGHISCIQESRKHGDHVAVIVNGDWFLKQKNGKYFQDLQTRCMIVSSLRGVDYVIPFEIEDDLTVCSALEAIQPDVFTKGGDRTPDTTPEYGLCQELGIEFVSGVGLDKIWSNNTFLKEWSEFGKENKKNAAKKF